MKRLLNYFAFCNVRHSCFIVAAFFGGTGYYIPYNLMYSMMIESGRTKDHSSLTISLTGVGSIASPVSVGFIGDYKCFHRIYYFIFAVTLVAIINALVVHVTEVL